MSSKPFSWRVIGITKEALKKLQQLNYRYKSGEGLTRAHLRPRIETVQELLNRDEPMSEYDFIEYWLTHDRTVICAKGENRPTIVDFIPIENPHGSLFSSNSVAWKHGKAECDLLKSLYEKHFVEDNTQVNTRPHEAVDSLVKSIPR